MGQLLADIFITTKGRPHLFERTLELLVKNTPADQYRLTVICDGGEDRLEWDDSEGVPVHSVIVHGENIGLGPSINEALAHIDATNRWFGHPTHGDPSKVAPFVCYIQDDILVSPGWLERLTREFTRFEGPMRLAFASGIESIEHQEGRQDLPGGLQVKRYIRAANMFARRETWMSMWPIPPLDPETGRMRAKPNDGMGSGVDWWFMRNHPNSVEKTGRQCLVIPGLMVHAGFAESTWLKRELPESDADKERVKKEMER